MVDEIGGFFELELPKRNEYHNKALALNSGRNCLIFALKAYGIQKLYYPYFSCETMLQAINYFLPHVEVHYYHIDAEFQPILPPTFQKEEWLLYINFFGICSNNIPVLGRHSIIDNCQSFFTLPQDHRPTFYSPRKFFGVPDGGYIYTKQFVDEELARDVSLQRAKHLMKRIDLSASQAYADFQAAEESLENTSVRRMSNLTHRILSSIDYDFVIKTRRENFAYLHNHLFTENKLSNNLKHMQEDNGDVPFVYPFLTGDGNNLREKLIGRKIYIAKYWPPDLLNYGKLSQIEMNFVENVVPLPVDQRYSLKDMDRILDVING